VTTRQLGILIRVLRREGVAEYTDGGLTLKFHHELAPNRERSAIEEAPTDAEPDASELEGHPSEHLARYYDEKRKNARDAAPKRRAS